MYPSLETVNTFSPNTIARRKLVSHSGRHLTIDPLCALLPIRSQALTVHGSEDVYGTHSVFFVD